MRPDIKHILQERFTGHEADVDPGLWHSIQSGLAASGTTSDPIQEHFRQELNGHEADVDPGLWEAISSQIGQGVVAGTGAAAASSGIMGWAAAGLVVLVVAAGVYLASDRGTPAELAILPTAERQVVIETTPPSSSETSAVIIEEAIIEEETASSLEAPINKEPKEAVAATTPSTVPIEKSVEPAKPIVETGLPEPTEATQAAPNEEVTAEEVSTPGDEAKEPAAAVSGPVPSSDEVGAQVVESVMKQLTREVEIDAMTTPDKDPVGPPIETVEEPQDSWTMEKKESTLAALPEIHLPNTFTPNGDGINDTYFVDRSGFQHMLISIYSLTNNQLVFSTNSNEEWDGANCGKGYYMVAVEALTTDGRLVTKGKAVWLNKDTH